MICRACGSADLGPLPFDPPEDCRGWRRCRACGSDTSDRDYAGLAAEYSPEWVAGLMADMALMERECRPNCGWFGPPAAGRDFLDVGCADGAALRVMASLGWSVHGFDVVRPPYAGDHVTVAPAFAAALFPRRYDAVLCREVVEHVERPADLLREVAAAARAGGLVQVQTPAPLSHLPAPPPYDGRICYQRLHLCLISPPQLRRLLRAAGLAIQDEWQWAIGQAYLCRREEAT